jgi:hypothetical protein
MDVSVQTNGKNRLCRMVCFRVDEQRTVGTESTTLNTTDFFSAPASGTCTKGSVVEINTRDTGRLRVKQEKRELARLLSLITTN